MAAIDVAYSQFVLVWSLQGTPDALANIPPDAHVVLIPLDTISEFVRNSPGRGLKDQSRLPWR
jgi:hypothetical protein